MSCLKIYSNNLVDNAVITPATENLNFPATNMQDPRRTKVYRSTASSVSVIFDFQETSEIDSVFIVDEPRNGFGISTIGFDFNATSNFTSPAYSDTMTFSVKHGMGIKSFVQQDYRFARINLTSALSYSEISKIFIGKVIDLGKGPSLNWSYQDKELSTVKENRYGQKFVDVISRQKYINISLKLLNSTQMEQIFEVYDEKGTTKPFFIEIGDDIMTADHRRFSGMVYLNTIPVITNTSYGRYSMSLQLEEAL